MLLTTPFLDMNQKILTKRRLFPKCQLIPILNNTSLCTLVLLHRLLCLISYVKIVLISHQNDFCLNHMGKYASWRRAINRCNKCKIWNFFESTLCIIGSMPLSKPVSKQADLQNECSYVGFILKTLSQ